MASSDRLAKNTTYLTIASIFQKIISFGYYAYLADAIGAAKLGQYTFALAFASIFVIFMDFGLGPLLTREGAKEEHKLQYHFERIFGIKLALIVISFVALMITVHVAEPLFENITLSDVRLIYVAAVIIVLDTLTFTFFSILRAIKRLHWEAVAIVIYQTVIIAAGITALQLGLSLTFVIGALLIGSAFQLVFIFTIIKTKTNIKLRPIIDRKSIRNTLKLAAPFAIAGIIFRLNGSADSLMLKTMVGDSFAGWYSLAFKLTFALTVLPGAFATSYFPTVSEYFKNAKHKLHIAFESGIFYMIILSLPIVVGTTILGDNIILSVWGYDWEASIVPLWIFMVGLPFVFLNYPIGNFLNAVDKQKLNTINMFIALLVNIGLNAILIPVYTFNGAAVAAVSSAIVLVLLGLPWVYKIAPFNWQYIAKKMFLVGSSAAIMAFVLFFIQHNYNILLLIPIGALVYGAALLLTSAVTKEELLELKGAIIKRS